MYFHVIENAQRDGQPVYRLTKTYKRFSFLVKHLLSSGSPVWIIVTPTEYLPETETLGGQTVSYFNTGGWDYGRMPVLPFWKGK